MNKYRITGYSMSDAKFDRTIEANDEAEAVKKAKEMGLDTWARYSVTKVS